jgi:outer membrane protein assembly factor BamB
MNLLRAALSIVVLSVFTIIWVSCEDYPVDYSLSDDPTNPSPPDGATNVSINADLYWDCEARKEGYSTIFSVYFGTDANPPLVDTIDSTYDYVPHYDPGELQKNTKYYWKIVNFDDTTGRTESSPVWSFTTGENAGGPGGQIWSYVTGRYIQAPVIVADGKVFFGSGDSNFYCLDAATGALIWSYQVDLGNWFEGQPAYANGFVYFADFDGTGNTNAAYCLDADDGSVVWTYDDAWSRGELADVYNGNVYIGMPTGVLCLDCTDGTRVWERDFDDWVDSGPVLYNGNVYLAANTTRAGGEYKDGYFYCLSSDDGDTVWEYEEDGGFTSHPSIVNDRVYVGFEEGPLKHYLYCLDAVTGTKVWESSCGDAVSGFVSNGDGRVYCGCDDGRVYCFNASTGAEVWSYDVGTGGVLPYGDTYFGGTFYYGGQVFLGSSAGYGYSSNYVYCLNAANGNLVWRYRTAGAIGCWPVVVNDRVYVGSYNDYTMYCLATKSGQVLAGASGPGQPSEGPAVGKRGPSGKSVGTGGKNRGK